MEHGKPIVPTVVFFDPKKNTIFVGSAAKRRLITNPKYTLFDFKRLLGMKMDDKFIEENKKLWLFDLEANE